MSERVIEEGSKKEDVISHTEQQKDGEKMCLNLLLYTITQVEL